MDFIKKIFILFFLLICSESLTNEKFKIIATVNNVAITNIDLINEIEVIKIINKNDKIDISSVKNIALNTLISENIKKNEINKNNIVIQNIIIQNNYDSLLKKNNISKNTIKSHLEKLLKEKISIELSWNELILKKFFWKININMNEIEQKTIQMSQNNDDKNKFDSLKENLIKQEKMKKLNVYSNYYLNKIKNQTFIELKQ